VSSPQLPHNSIIRPPVLDFVCQALCLTLFNYRTEMSPSTLTRVKQSTEVEDNLEPNPIQKRCIWSSETGMAAHEQPSVPVALRWFTIQAFGSRAVPRVELAVFPPENNNHRVVICGSRNLGLCSDLRPAPGFALPVNLPFSISRRFPTFLCVPENGGNKNSSFRGHHSIQASPTLFSRETGSAMQMPTSDVLHSQRRGTG
jgi:hypothetical protein